ncbi:hypothetical protein CPC08DRAFT_620995, partial [Agrocybe pediades]
NEDGLEPHPYWYARVVGIFHVNVRYRPRGSQELRPRTQKMEFLWVRWMGRDLSYQAGWKARRLYRVGFVPDTSSRAFGFLDPAEVIRGAHLIPAFAHGTTASLLPPSFIRRKSDSAGTDLDWQFFYVNSFVDRDMFMRYFGDGVGH